MRKTATAQPRRPRDPNLRRPMPANHLFPTQRRFIMFEKIGRYAEMVATSACRHVWAEASQAGFDEKPHLRLIALNKIGVLRRDFEVPNLCPAPGLIIARTLEWGFSSKPPRPGPSGSRSGTAWCRTCPTY